MASEAMRKERTELQESHTAWLKDPTESNTTRYGRAKNNWVAVGLSYRNGYELTWVEQTLPTATERAQAEVERLTKEQTAAMGAIAKIRRIIDEDTECPGLFPDVINDIGDIVHSFAPGGKERAQAEEARLIEELDAIEKAIEKCPVGDSDVVAWHTDWMRVDAELAQVRSVLRWLSQ